MDEEHPDYDVMNEIQEAFFETLYPE